MNREMTREELQALIESLNVAFDVISVTELDEAAGDEWQDEGLEVDYELGGGEVRCVLRRVFQADGRYYRVQISAPLAGSDLPEDRMSEREREMCREDMNRDFLTGVYNRRYLETVLRRQVEMNATAGQKVAAALVSLDRYSNLQAEHGQSAIEQMLCYLANQWKKHYNLPGSRVVCRMNGNIFMVVCMGSTGKELEEEMRSLYEQMPCECVTSTGMMCRIPFTLSIGCAGVEEVDEKSWDALCALTDKRMRAVAAAGGNAVYTAQ